MEIVAVVAALILVAIFAALAALRSLIIICPPNMVAVISGRSRALSDGRTVGYRVLKGGRTLRVPLLEKVSWIGLNTMPIDVEVTNAFSKGAIPLNVQAIANVKVSSSDGLLENAVERFLENGQGAIAEIAKETLEANLRGVLATLTPEEVNEDRLKFSQTLIDEADDDVKTLGLELDTLKIQNVYDDVQYLDSVGRRQTAQVIKEARVAEAVRQAESEEAEADGRRRAEIAQVNADLVVVEQRNNLRVRTAELEAVAAAKEAEAKVAGEKARVVAEQSLESERIDLVKRRLEADVITPARAELEARQLQARADAAPIIEDGTAQVEVFRRLAAQFRETGPGAERIFVLNILPELVERIAATIEGVDIDRVSIIGGGDGREIGSLLGQLPASVISLTEQIENATGVDILSNLRHTSPEARPEDRLGADGNGAPAVSPPALVEEGGTVAAEPSASDGPDERVAAPGSPSDSAGEDDPDGSGSS